MSIIVSVAVISGLGLFFGIGLAYASKVFEVKARKSEDKGTASEANCAHADIQAVMGLLRQLLMRVFLQ